MTAKKLFKGFILQASELDTMDAIAKIFEPQMLLLK